MSTTVKIEPNYKVTIPKDARDAFDLHVGEEVEITFASQKHVKEGIADPQEIRAIEKGRNAYARDKYISLTDYVRGVETSTHKTRTKRPAKNS